MNRSESKYFNTAILMDKALLKLLETKDFSYITVKEICQTAGVNRSTFYLHYETIADLLNESIAYMNQHFLDYMNQDTDSFLDKLNTCPIDALYLATPEYLTPYLNYIRDHKKLFRSAMENASVLQMYDSYNRMFQYIFVPILERFHVPDEDRSYLITFYIHGIMAIISKWLKSDCSDSIEHMTTLIQQCVYGRNGLNKFSKLSD